MRKETILLLPLFLTAVFAGAVPRLIAVDRYSSVCTSVGLSCYNCTHPVFCLPTGESYFVECPDNTPHCNNGGCTSTQTPGCEAPGNFTCTGEDGYYPDPDNCLKYYLCVASIPYEFNCDTNQVYSHAKSTCVKKIYTSDCAVIKCGSVRPSVAVYPKDDSVYGLCLPDEKTRVYKCPREHSYDVQKGACVYKCTKEGRFEYPGDDRKYYECVLLSSNRYEVRVGECPQGLVFDGEIQRCNLRPITVAPRT